MASLALPPFSFPFFWGTALVREQNSVTRCTALLLFTTLKLKWMLYIPNGNWKSGLLQSNVELSILSWGDDCTYACLENIKQIGYPTCCAMDWKRRGKKKQAQIHSFLAEQKVTLECSDSVERVVQIYTGNYSIQAWTQPYLTLNLFCIPRHPDRRLKKNRERGETFCIISVSKLTERR